MGILGTALEPFGGVMAIGNQLTKMTSLDHSVWFHQADEWRSDEWMLFDMKCHM